MRGLVAGLFSFAVFFYSLSLVLPKFNLFAAYTIAIICALIVQFISLRYIQRVPKKNNALIIKKILFADKKYN
ncbi:hypothetical protein J4731_11415 [Providencia rettgeri]|nr:hypothetical protein [Providencia rettgeri]